MSGTDSSPGGRAHSTGFVLVVDDDPLVGEMIAEHLSGRGWPTEAVETHPEALRIVRARRPDVVVIDQMLDDACSRELVRQLAALGGEAPRVVLIRYAHGPIPTWVGLDVTVVAGEQWFEQLHHALSLAARPPAGRIPPVSHREARGGAPRRRATGLDPVW